MPYTPPIELTRREMLSFCASPLAVSIPVLLVLGGGQWPPGFLLCALHSVFASIAKAYALAMLVFLPLYAALKSRGRNSFVRVAASYLGAMAAFQALYSLVEGWLGVAAAESVHSLVGASPYGPLSDAGALVCLAAFWGIAYEFTLSPVPGNGLERPLGGRPRGAEARSAGLGPWRTGGRRAAVLAVLRANAALLALFAAAHALALLSAAGPLADSGAGAREARARLSGEIEQNFTVIAAGSEHRRFVPASSHDQIEAVIKNELALRQYYYLERFSESRDVLRSLFHADGSAPSSRADGTDGLASARELTTRYSHLGYSSLDRKLVVLVMLFSFAGVFVLYFVVFPAIGLYRLFS